MPTKKKQPPTRGGAGRGQGRKRKDTVNKQLRTERVSLYLTEADANWIRSSLGTPSDWAARAVDRERAGILGIIMSSPDSDQPIGTDHGSHE